MDAGDELNEYLHGDSALSRQYRGESAPEPPHALDRAVLRATRRPSEWLAEIAALRRSGRLREAAVEMQRFHSIYPHYIVPSDE